MSETHYRDGTKDGVEILWYESGEKKKEIHFKNGEKKDWELGGINPVKS